MTAEKALTRKSRIIRNPRLKSFFPPERHFDFVTAGWPVARGLWNFPQQHFYARTETIVLRLDGTGPLYQQVCRAFRGEILSRALAPGERVPSTAPLPNL
jgi:hypothetical protein